MSLLMNNEKLDDFYANEENPALDNELKIGDEGYVLKEGDPGFEAPATELKFGDEGYVLKEGDEGYEAPTEELKLGDEGYILKEGDPGYVPPVELKPGDEGYVEPAVPKKAELTQEEKDKIFNDYLAEFGLSSADDLKELQKKASETPETEEQKAARIEEYNNSVTAFGIQQKIITPTDLAAIENIKSQDDRSIAYKEFADSYKNVHKDRTKENSLELDPVTEEEINEQFENFFNLDSDNAGLKTMGERLIKERADIIRNGALSKLDVAKQRWDAEVHKNTHVPAFKTFLQDTVSKAVKDQITLFEEGSEKVVFNLKDESGKPLYDVDAIAKSFVSDFVYDSYLKDADKSKVKEFIEQGVANQIYMANKEQINKLIYQQGKAAGVKAGAVGAAAPFREKETPKAVEVTEQALTESDTQNLKNQFTRR